MDRSCKRGGTILLLRNLKATASIMLQKCYRSRKARYWRKMFHLDALPLVCIHKIHPASVSCDSLYIMRGVQPKGETLKAQLFRSVFEPLLFRLGSLTAGALVGVGLAAQHGPAVETVVTALGLLAAELVARKWVRR